MYRIEYLNCPHGTRCALPTLHKLFSPITRSLGSEFDYFCYWYKDTARDLAKEYVNMIQRMFEHAGLVAIGFVVYVSTEPSFVSTLLTGYTGSALVYLSRLLPPTSKVFRPTVV